MSLKFNWNFFDVKDLQRRFQAAITESIAQAPRPASIAEPIRATKLDFGTKPPDLSFNSVLSVSLRRTHITFALKYDGDASLTLETAIQANTLREPLMDPTYPAFVRPKVVGCLDVLVIPFRLQLKNIVLDSIVDVVYTKSGVIINFREEDPVKNIETISSLDMIPGVKKLIASMMQEQIKSSFSEDIPESVWTSTSPKRTPPDPFFGITRWSQYERTEIRFNSFSLSSTAFLNSASYIPTQSLSLLSPLPLLSPPNAMLTPVNLLDEQQHDSTNSNKHARRLSSDSWKQFVQEPSMVSETASVDTQSSTKWKPRRRVINLKKLTQGNAEPDKDKQPADRSILSQDAERAVSYACYSDHSSDTTDYDSDIRYGPVRACTNLDNRRYSSPANISIEFDKMVMKKRAQSVHKIRSSPFLATDIT
ncbi:hypothetical protein DASB73_027670 [Starmerella bacillaris]|uniref:SMP-LTD domain-containing protein n=1 Tax=Starmerella bacillaris TaxID=1247836 RepID=A0AAV5RJS5_STABA|nr:hypothetical protein DASB73_027670 [Starmerella bacillaris]